MRRLNKALHKRQNAEIDIWKQLKALEKSRKALAKLLIEVCHARLETTAEISTTGRVPEKAPKLVCKRVIWYWYDNADDQSSDPRETDTRISHTLCCYTNFAIFTKHMYFGGCKEDMHTGESPLERRLLL